MKYREILWLLPLLVFYLVVCIIVADDSLEYDQSRYVMYAENLTKGFYAPEDTLYLWNGPGYPIILMPFAAAKIPYICAKFLNPFFLFAGMCFIYILLRQYITKSKALWGAYLLGLYPPFLIFIPMLLTETISVMLSGGFILFLVMYHKTNKLKYFILAGIFGSYLILTKVVFAYVLTVSMFFFFAFVIWKRQYLKTALICLLSLLFCTPYLIYTYSLTGKPFYWANSSGGVIYWMSNPYPNEYGDWRLQTMVFKDERVSRHKPFFEKMEGLNYVEQDKILKQQALENIRNHPAKYALNLVCNLGRLWLNYPFSYKEQRPQTLIYMLPNSFLFAGTVCCAIALLIRINKLPTEIISMMLISVTFIGCSLLISSGCRFLIPAVPILAALISYTVFNLIEIKFRVTIDS